MKQCVRLEISRGRCIAPIADLSALSGFTTIQNILLIPIIWPPLFFFPVDISRNLIFEPDYRKEPEKPVAFFSWMNDFLLQ
jgi:hypothetical protein